MSDFGKARDAISFIGGPLLNGDYSTVNAAISKKNTAVTQGQAALSAALGG